MSSHCGTVEMNPTRSHEVVGSIPGVAWWVNDPALPLSCWCRSQTWLGSGLAVAVAVAQASSYSSDQTPGLGTSICHRCNPKKTKDIHTYIHTYIILWVQAPICVLARFRLLMLSVSASLVNSTKHLKNNYQSFSNSPKIQERVEHFLTHSVTPALPQKRNQVKIFKKRKLQTNIPYKYRWTKSSTKYQQI